MFEEVDWTLPDGILLVSCSLAMKCCAVLAVNTHEELAAKVGHPYLCARNNTGILDRFNGVKDEGA